MFIDIVLIGIAVLFGGLALLFKKRVGVPILALFAGAFLSSSITPVVATGLAENGVATTNVALDAIVAISIVLLPAIIALMTAQKGGSLFVLRLISCIVFGIVAAVLLVPYLPGIFNAELFTAARLDDIAVDATDWVVIVGIAVALADLLFAKLGIGNHDKGKKAHKH